MHVYNSKSQESRVKSQGSRVKGQGSRVKGQGSRPEKGFTLIELSIVIVIIGLIVAGVVGGQALVEQAKLRQQIADLKKYEIAVNTFKLEYNSIPGDFINANSYWGVAGGDGNGRMSNYVADMSDPNLEGIKFFYHLSLAGLLTESYNGTWELGVGYPSLKIAPSKGLLAGGGIEGCCASAHQLSVASATKLRKLGLYMEVSNPDLVGGGFNDQVGVLTPRVASNIDTKIDDGVARTGKFESYRVLPNGAPLLDCLTGDEGDYDLTGNTAGCMSGYIIFD
ncbi:MAG: prepilin-type N-terminal cleavage/methylation domain-containing protein [Rickettsiales bacterium]|nr:prepilin-type N-terminal cleavage/methylation domain-containing protein [Pseudomonadota bacterium]MDA0967132.1 prepilin-type N-terminal cleavage/methylation domain-containing protein [Pseudomonadota bacterium]MDG4542382.1 prepilin-type N-terminal cleavage/methylation domain-containing protein [Rickettsiales bacterium]MDG4544886.1 prepilin-type N-terminal cleavage/methylation domain-containing protein [Rickettsiales bacterium]MDG4547009.1 prepilin-type N-terminal cleavage/methylation domain-c